MSLEDPGGPDLDEQIDAKINMGDAARKAKQMVVDRFTAMIDKDPEKAVNTIRALLRKD